MAPLNGALALDERAQFVTSRTLTFFRDFAAEYSRSLYFASLFRMNSLTYEILDVPFIHFYNDSIIITNVRYDH